MSRTTDNNTDTTVRTLHAVTTAPADTDDVQPPTAETKVRDALRDNPGTTVAALAIAAGVGRSTASKILVQWEKEGTVTRTAGKDQRAPATWAPQDTSATPQDGTDDHDTTASAAPVGDVEHAPDEAPADDVSVDPDLGDAPADRAHAETPADHADASNGHAPAPTESASPETTHATPDAPAHASSTDDTPIPEPVAGTEPAMEQGIAPEPAQIAVSDTDRTAATVTASPAVDPATGVSAPPEGKAQTDAPTVVKGPRLGKGALRGMVEDFLTKHPGVEFGPAAIGKELVRSSGAVSNALDKLAAEDGPIVKTQGVPRRFAYTADAK